MNIGIDIDGVLTDVRQFMIDEGLKYCEESNKGKLVNLNAYNSYDIFNWGKEADTDFWVKNIFFYAENNPVIEGASENIKKLKEKGHKIYIITARWLTSNEDSELFNDINTGEKMRFTVKQWLAKNNIVYDEVIFSGSDKSHTIIENDIDVMIDDAPRNLIQLSKFIKVICYDWPYNKEVAGNNIYRCSNWNEIYAKVLELN